jgi:hypothetical protein
MAHEIVSMINLGLAAAFLFYNKTNNMQFHLGIAIIFAVLS